jgi:hypothetical protein
MEDNKGESSTSLLTTGSASNAALVTTSGTAGNDDSTSGEGALSGSGASSRSREVLGLRDITNNYSENTNTIVDVVCSVKGESGEQNL